MENKKGIWKITQWKVRYKKSKNFNKDFYSDLYRSNSKRNHVRRLDLLRRRNKTGIKRHEQREMPGGRALVQIL